MAAKLALSAQDVVGESLVRDDRRNRLVRVDIMGRRIRSLDPATGAYRLWPVPGHPTSIGLCTDGSAIPGMQRLICR